MIISNDYRNLLFTDFEPYPYCVPCDSAQHVILINDEFICEGCNLATYEIED